MDDRKRSTIITELKKLKRQIVELAATITGSSSSGDVTGPASSTNDDFVAFNGTTGKIIKDSGVSLDTNTGLTANSDAKVASQKATKTYADAKVADAIADAVTTVAPSQNAVFDALALKVPTSRQVNGHALSADVTVTKGDVGLGSVTNDAQLKAADLDIDGTLAANSDTKIPSQKAVKTYADALIAANDAMVFKGVIDCSANPNYPAANRGDTYRVSVAGKIGGASGTNVEAGDLLICLTDGTAAGTQAAVGASWTIAQANIDGAVTGAASSTGDDFATFNGASGKVIKDSGLSLDTDTALAANSDSKIPSQKAVKTYADTKQPLDTDLTTIAGLTATTDNFMVASGSAWASRTPAQARTHMGLGSLATLSTVGTAQIDNDAVTYAKLQNISATSRVLGRITAGAGDTEELTAADIKTILGLTKSDVGLGNVTNDAQLKAADLDTDVTLAADSNTKIPSQHAVKSYVTSSVAAAGGGDVSSDTATSVDAELALFKSTTGKLIKRATLTGLVKATSGVASAAVAGTDYLTPTPGLIEPYAGRIAPTGYLMCDGSTVSRSTYAGLFAVICEAVGTFTVTLASPGVFTLVAHGLNTGDQIYLTTTGALPTGLTANTLYYVVKVTADTFNLSTSRANAYAGTKINTSGSQSGTHTLRWCPYGLGDGSTTFTLPDGRGRTLAGADAMGGTAASRLTLADPLGSYGNPGASGGEQRHTMALGELATHAHTKATQFGPASTGGTFQDGAVWAHVSATSGGTVPNTGNAGSSTPFNLISPTLVANYIIKT